MFINLRSLRVLRVENLFAGESLIRIDSLLCDGTKFLAQAVFELPAHLVEHLQQLLEGIFSADEIPIGFAHQQIAAGLHQPLFGIAGIRLRVVGVVRESQVHMNRQPSPPTP